MRVVVIGRRSDKVRKVGLRSRVLTCGQSGASECLAGVPCARLALAHPSQQLYGRRGIALVEESTTSLVPVVDIASWKFCVPVGTRERLVVHMSIVRSVPCDTADQSARRTRVTFCTSTS